MSALIWYPGHELILRDIVRAENCHLYDAAGNRYVDLESGVWCTSIGHGHPAVRRAITEQVSRITHTGFAYSTGIVEQAGAELLTLLGFGGGRCVFLCSGSEAVEYCVRLVQSVDDRPLLLTMVDSYFGAYGSAARRDETEWFDFDWAPCVECPHDGDCSERCDHWSAIPFEQIGGFVFEPGSSSGLVRFPPEKLIRAIADVVRHEDGLVLVNEVTTGIGRTGHWFGYQHYDISPDVVALGKGIGNGYPVSVAAFASEVVEGLGAEPLKYAQSHQNDPLGAAVARAVVRVIEEDELIDRGREIAATLLSGMTSIQERCARLSGIRARGLMFAVELHDGPDCLFTIQVHRELVRRGYVVGRRPGLNVLRLDPSLTIEREEVEGFLKSFESVLVDVAG